MLTNRRKGEKLSAYLKRVYLPELRRNIRDSEDLKAIEEDPTMMGLCLSLLQDESEAA